MTTDQIALQPHAELQIAADRACNWLCDVAAPLWAERGRTASGLFAERMTLTGEPDSSYFRTFVQARHIYAFCAIGRMGWNGPWRELVTQTVEVLLNNARRPDGFFVHRLAADASVADARADLYDQAFVLFALGTAGGALGEPRWFDAAEALFDTIEREWSHPAGGFTEGEIVDPSVRRQNPHMHLFEASQALWDASGRSRFQDLAYRIAELAAGKFIDPASGALLEYFEQDWTPAKGDRGRIAEPGHCFEWAWLFDRLARAGWVLGEDVASRLIGFARKTGIDPVRGVAINEVLTDGAIADGKARLWPQTERIKAAVSRYHRSGDGAEAAEVVAALRGLEQYYAVETPGLWRDKLGADGNWLDELAPGSSLYHISCAYAELASCR